MSIRKGCRVEKNRIYLGANLSNLEISKKERMADNRFKLTNKKTLREIELLKSRIAKILKENNVKRAGIFGSYAKGNAKKNSDIDILIVPPKNMGFKFAALEIRLSKVLKKPVDLVSYHGISPYLKKIILGQEIRIL